MVKPIHVRATTCGAILAIALLVVAPVRAATVGSLTDVVSSHLTSTEADHTVTFTTQSAVSEGETIRLEFDASFSTGGILEDDVDITDDGVDLTTAADCSGSEQASVVMAADVLTITVCAGDGGAVAVGSIVVVQIGANATSSGTGSNQVAHPANPGTYAIRLRGTFGDEGNVWVPVIASGLVALEAEVDLIPLDPGGGGGGCYDSIAPIVSSVGVDDVTETSATISWTTNESATSVVDYGTTTAYGQTQSSDVMVLAHSVSLSGLTAGTVYHFAASSLDICDNVGTSGDLTFTTDDTTPPTIGNVVVSNITPSSAMVSWETNEPTTSILSYGPTTAYGSTVVSAVLSMTHEVLLSGLVDATTYHFSILATDALANSASTSDQTFTTLADLPPGNVSGFTATPGDGENTLLWTLPPDTDLASITLVWRTDRFPTSLTDGSMIGLGLVGMYLHQDLHNGTTYYYVLFVHDNAGQTSSGALALATPQEVAEVVEVVEEEVEEEAVEEEEVLPEHDELDELEEEDEDVVLRRDEIGGGGAVCGNRICEEDETESSCPMDCTLEIIEPAPTAGGMLVDLDYLVALDTIELFPVSGVVSVLPARPLRLLAHIDAPEGAAIQAIVGAERFLLDRTGPLASAIITTPAQTGSVGLRLLSVVGEEEHVLASSLLTIEPFGYTFETLEGVPERVGGSRVTLYRQSGDFSVWESAGFGQLNPLTTPQDGSFAWYVPLGTYAYVAEASGYKTVRTAPVFVANAIATTAIELKREPPPIREVITTSGSVTGKLAQITEILFRETADALEIVRRVPGVSKSVTVAAPAVLAASVTTAAVLSLSFDLLPFLQYLVTSPVLLFWRRRRKKWGVVYDAIQKTPIDLAIVRLYRLTDGRLVQSRVTDKYGRYFFLIDPGQYRIGVTKMGYTFPTDYLGARKEDGGFVDLYHGEPIEVEEVHATVAANIPLDPASRGALHRPFRVRLQAVLRSTQHLVAVVGLVLASAVVVLRPSVYTAVVLGVQGVVYLLIRRLAKPHKPRGWGIVYDRRTGSPLRNVVVRVFEPDYDKLLQTAVTDRKGRYTFLVGPNAYYTRYEKKGFKPMEVRPIDFTDKQEPTDIAIDVKLDPEAKRQPPE